MNTDIVFGTVPKINITGRIIREGCLKYVGEYTEPTIDTKCCVCNKVLVSRAGSGRFMSLKVPKNQIVFEQVSYRNGRLIRNKDLWFCRDCYSASHVVEIVQRLENS